MVHTSATLDTIFNGSLCWRVEANGGISYIFGSVHQIDIEKIPLPISSLSSLLDETKSLCVETELSDESPDAMNSMFSSGDDAAPHSLTDDLGEEYYQRLIHVLKQSTDGAELLPMLDKFPLSLIALLITIEKQQQSQYYQKNSSTFQIEKYFADMSRDKGYPILPLETLEEHLAFVSAKSSRDEQITALKKAVDNYDDPETPDMYAQYAKQDLRLLRAEDMVDPAMTQRNEMMTRKLLQVINERTSLAIVGAAHLPYATGILALLEKSGCRVSPHHLA